MPTTEDLASMWHASGLKQKIIFTLIMLAAFRLGAQLPLFGINNEAFKNIASSNNLVGFLDMFTGGALGNVSIFALGIGPYITAAIMIQLLSVIVPALEKYQKEEGEAGRRKLAQCTRILTLVMTVMQSLVFILYMKHAQHAIISNISFGWFCASSVLALTAGSMLVMWIAEIITEKGIGNGASLIIFTGIVAGIPLSVNRTYDLVSNDPSLRFGLFMMIAIYLATMVVIVIMQEATRKVIIVNPKRQVGNKVYGGMNSFIPFKLNPGGVMPIIFAIAIIMFPATVLSLVGQANFKSEAFKTFIMHATQVMSPEGATYYIIYFTLIVLLTFFYSSTMPNMQPKDIADNLKKYGSSIPGIKPGKPTADALNTILSRVIFIGAFALAIVALMPSFASYITNIKTFIGLSSTALIILAGVAHDLINQIRSHLLARNYESFLKQ